MKAISEQTKKTLTLILMALTTLPFLFVVNVPDDLSISTDNFDTLALYGSAVTGYVGVAIILWQFMLGTRTVTGLFFKDLPWTLRVHTKLGIWGTLLIFLHPILITYAYGESLLYSLSPSFSNEFETHVTFGRIGLVALLIVWFTSAIVRGKIAYRPWKYVHYLSYLVLPATLLHVPDIGSSFANTLIQFYWYSFVALFLLFVVLRLRHLFGFGKLSYVVDINKQLSPDVHMIRLLPANKGVRIELGQYVYLQKKLIGEEHPFTVLQSNKETGEITVAFKKFGKYTHSLAKIKKGDHLLVDGPYGIFTNELNANPGLPSVFIAGGIGITPFVSHVLRSDKSADQMMFFANRTKDSAVFRDILKKNLGDNFIEIFNKAPSTIENGQEVGRLNAEMLDKYIDQPARYNYFICGPQGLMDACKLNLKSLGVPDENIHLEEFGF